MICEKCGRDVENVLYAQRRDNLIHKAEAHANRMFGVSGPGAELKPVEHDAWVWNWNVAFHKKINELARDAGL